MQILGLDIGANNIKAVQFFGESPDKMEVNQIQLRRHSIDSINEDLQYINEYLDISDEVYVYVVNSVTMYGHTNQEGLATLNNVLVRNYDVERLYHVTGDGQFILANHEENESIYNFIGTNFYSSAYLASKFVDKGVLIDTGTSSTDIIAFENEQLLVKAWKRSDYNRLSTGELSFTGSLHTMLEFLIHEIPFRGNMTSICTGLVNTGHVYALLGFITPQLMEDEFKTDWEFEHAKERIGRLVGSDYELLGEEELDNFLKYIYKAHVNRISDLVKKVLADYNCEGRTIVGLGLGSTFLTNEVAKEVNLPYIQLNKELNGLITNIFSALGVAVLGWEHQARIKLNAADIRSAVNGTEQHV
jgi:probable H4MPT-linked C1 transfer pathway protein